MTGIVVNAPKKVEVTTPVHPREFRDPQHYFESMCAINSAKLRQLQRALPSILGGLPSGNLAIVTTGSDGRGENIGSKIDLTLLCEHAIQARCLKTLLSHASGSGELAGLPLGLSNFIDPKYLHGNELHPMIKPGAEKESSDNRENTMLGVNPRLTTFGLNTTPQDFRELRTVRLLDAALVYGDKAVIKQAQHLMVEELAANPDVLKSTIISYENLLKDSIKTLQTGTSKFKGDTLTHFSISDDNVLTSHIDEHSLRSVKYGILRVLQNRLTLDFLIAIKEDVKARPEGTTEKLKEMISIKDPNLLLQKWDELGDLSYAHKLVDHVFSSESGIVGRLSTIGTFGFSDVPHETISKAQDIYKLGLWVYHFAQVEHGLRRDSVEMAAPRGVDFKKDFADLAEMCKKPIIRAIHK